MIFYYTYTSEFYPAFIREASSSNKYITNNSLVLIYMGLLVMGTNESLNLACSTLGTLLLGCHAQLRYGNFCLILFFMFDYYILEACSFLIEDRKGCLWRAKDVERNSGE